MFKFIKDFQLLFSAIILAIALVVAAFRLSSSGRYSSYERHVSNDDGYLDSVVILDTFTGKRVIRESSVSAITKQSHASLWVDDPWHEKPYDETK